MAGQLRVEVVAVEQRVWTGDAEMVVARTTEGELGILPGHAPLLGQLAEPGEVRVKRAGGEQLAWEVSGGFLSVTADGVTVLAETAVPTTPAATR
ncbi:MAG: F0F1 ATP synthase subunit epsilon [Micromonosporaceae bacterium]|nr:F0F1 ATP synthase subunit epsilon [Micromonosporaceae bacterium]